MPIVTDNPAVLVAMGVGLAAPFLVWSATRPRPDTARALTTMGAEIFLTVVVAYVVARFVAMPGLHWLARTI